MTTSVHKNLTGSDLHEPKGADTALLGSIYVSNGAGSGVWTAASSVLTNAAWNTGDLKITHTFSAPTGWIIWSDGTIGDGSSGATIRANADTAALFALYWGYDASLTTVSGGRGVSAVADFAAHKTVTLPKGAGRVLGISGTGAGLTSRSNGGTAGGETNNLITANLPPYTPSGTISLATVGQVSGQFLNNVATSGGGTMFNGGNNTNLSLNPTYNFTGSPQGGTSTAFSIMQPTSFVTVLVKL